MKFEIFKFEKVTSTNDIAINLIENEQKETGCVYADIQKKGEVLMGENGFQIKVIYSDQYFFL